jgi:predicted nucleotidyltransferase
MDMLSGLAAEQQAELAAWCERAGLQLCVLFGSRASEQWRPDSDYDLAALPAPAPLQRLEWQMQLEELLGGEIDLVALSPATEPVLGWEIARSGRLIYEARPGLWAAEQAKRWHSYNDALPFRRALAESLRSYAEEVRRGA